MPDSATLVQIIKRFPCLYNHTVTEYSRKDVTEKAWSEVARIMKWSVSECKEKWKNMRNGFVRSLKPGPSGAYAKQKKQYYLHDDMQFVVPYLRPIQTQNVGHFPFPPDDNEEELVMKEEPEETQIGQDISDIFEQQEQEETTPSKSRKRKIKPRANEVDNVFVDYLKPNTQTVDDDHRRMFLLSLLPDVNKLADVQMRAFKIRVLLLLDEIMNESQDQ